MGKDVYIEECKVVIEQIRENKDKKKVKDTPKNINTERVKSCGNTRMKWIK